MESVRRNASALAWAFAAIAVGGNAAAAFGADGDAFGTARLVVSLAFTVFLAIALAEWWRSRRRSRAAAD